MRDHALSEIVKQLNKGRVWFSEQPKHCKMLWEGLFFMFWHADKSLYQRDVSLKIAKILVDLGDDSNSWT